MLLGNAPHEADDRPYLGRTVARHLADLPVKMVGIDDSVFPDGAAFAIPSAAVYNGLVFDVARLLE